MLKLTWLDLFLQAIPECIAMTALSFALLNLEFKWSRIIIIGVAQGVTAYIIRLLPISYGIHSIFLIVSLAVYVHLVTKKTIISTLRTSVIGFLVLYIIDMSFVLIFLKASNLTAEILKSNQWLWIISGWPQIMVLLGLALFKNYWDQQKSKTFMA